MPRDIPLVRTMVAAQGRDATTFGFSDEASLDKGGMWPTSFALMKLTAAEEKQIAALVKKAVR